MSWLLIEKKNKRTTPPPEDRRLIGPNRIPDPYYDRRTPDGKLLDVAGEEIKLNENTAEVIGPHLTDWNKIIADADDLSAATQKKKLRLTDEKHQANLRILQRYKRLALLSLGIHDEIVQRKDNLPVEEMFKVWNYVHSRPDYDNPISTVVFHYDAGVIKTDGYKRGDPIGKFLVNRKFFRDHPDPRYLFWAKIFAIGILIGLGIAIADALFGDHSDQTDKQKTYFRARLVSSFAGSLAGVGASIVFFKHSIGHFIQATRLVNFLGTTVAIPCILWFYLCNYLNYPEDNAWGKALINLAFTFMIGFGVASHSLRKGPGLVRLMVPALLSSTAVAASLAISPYNLNLEFGTPITAVSSAMSGFCFAGAVFPAYKSSTRFAFGGLTALIYSGLLLSSQQAYLNRLKFQEKYFGTDVFFREVTLFIKSVFFIPLKILDTVAYQFSKRSN